MKSEKYDRINVLKSNNNIASSNNNGGRKGKWGKARAVRIVDRAQNYI